MEDFEQKGAMNDIVESRISHGEVPSKFVQWYDQTDKVDEQGQTTKSLSKDELVATVYFRCVEGFVYAHKIANKMLRLDSDTEQFAKLLMTPCSECMRHDGNGDITVGDILGKPVSALGEVDRADTNFSLITYSFNLNAAMRAQLASERSGHMSESELSFGGGAGGAVYGKNQPEKGAVGVADGTRAS